MALINSIEELRRYAKVNASTDWNTYSMYVQDAQQKYIVPYFGEDLLELISNKSPDTLRTYICRALGPFSLVLATHELSINFGEAGHTVTRTDKLAPASDAKIEKATESLLERAWHNLDRAISYALANEDKYPAWDTDFVKQLGTGLFGNHNDFQDNGMVDIGYSPLTFSRLRMLIKRIEQSETLLLIPTGYTYKTNENIFAAMQAYTASRVAELHTNADRDNNLKDAPPIQLLHEGGTESRNYYATQANYWKSKITELLIADDVIKDSREVKVNAQEKTIFFAGGSRIESEE